MTDVVLQRLRAEELTRRRRSDDYLRYVETFRCSTVDPNPHQVEAAMFALGRLPQGGALLCDEVGLGKTIEAALVIAQLRAEARGHVLIVVPLALARQWQVELTDLFGMHSTIIGAKASAEDMPRGVYIVGRETATSQKHAQALAAMGPWDLVVVDEAHEIFAGIYKRFGKRDGTYVADASKGQARRAAWLREVIGMSPCLLLTATPLQNNVFELWGLVHYVDRQSAVLGPFHEFSQIFVEGEGGRAVVPDMQATLRERLGGVLQRTLRSQAAPFLRLPFTKRHCTTLNFHLQDAERALYEDVSSWLGQEEMGAYRSTQRRLVALQLRRRMASSPQALAASLTHLRKRVEGLIEAQADEDRVELNEEVHDIEPALLHADLETLSRLEKTAQEVANRTFQKLELVLDLVRRVGERVVDGVVGDKLVIFTESRRTLDSIVRFLESNGFEGQVTPFSGGMEASDPLVARAVAHWEEARGQFLSPSERPELNALVRGALVYEFETRTRIFVSTEAGAKGLNLQFCNCMVNFDLPWNPQRIEQRIGRVHRYGQKHDVIIVNCINLDNEAERRVYDILAQKLQVFEGLLGASDEVLGMMGDTLDFEQRINELLDHCPTPQAVREAFDRLELELDAAARASRDATLERTRSLVSRLDNSVRLRLERIEGDMPAALSQRDQTLLDLLREADPLFGVERTDAERTVFVFGGRRYHLGPPSPSASNGEPLGVDHPVVAACIAEAVAATEGQVIERAGEEAEWRVVRVRFSGVETEEHLFVVGTAADLCDTNIGLCATNVCLVGSVDGIERALDREVEKLRQAIQSQQQPRVDRLLWQLASRREDMRLYAERQRAALQKKIEAAEKARRTAATPGAAARAASTHKKLLDELNALASEPVAMGSPEEQRIHAMRFVRAEVQPLFAVRRSPAVQEGKVSAT